MLEQKLWNLACGALPKEPSDLMTKCTQSDGGGGEEETRRRMELL